MINSIHLTIACGDYDRTEALRTGEVEVEGATLTYLALGPEEIFFRMIKYREFDVAEMSLSTYVLSLGDEPESSPFIAIPVFPSRVFRHNSIYVNANSGIEEPGDLVGRVVGIPEYQMTAAVWIRGILAEHYAVPVESIRYRTGGLHGRGRTEKLTFAPPPGIEIQPIPSDSTLAEMLVAGDIDALYSARPPNPLLHGSDAIRRLFHDPGQAEVNYYTATGIFPIMHTVVLRRALYVEHRWLARSLTKAFAAALERAAAKISETAALPYMLPWLADELHRTQRVMGAAYWPYGIQQNAETLRAFLRYSHEQGLAAKQWRLPELFAPETEHEFVV